MFSYRFKNNYNNIFIDNHYPQILRLFHNYNNPGWTYNYHLHKDATEIVYIANGKATYTIDMESHTLKKGQLLIMERGVLHSISSNEDDPVDAWTCIISNYHIKDFKEKNKMLNFNTYHILDTGIHEKFIKSLMEELYTLCLKENESSFFICDLMATTLISLIYELLPKNKELTHSKKTSFVRDILVYISEHYSEQITLKQLSEEFHMSAGHISHSFTKEYGISPINYSIDLKIGEAKLLLLHTDDSLTSIANKVGYENVNHFSKLFTKRVKYSPLEFRELHSKREKSKNNFTTSDINEKNEVPTINNELIDLKKDLDKLREENEILKKAMTIISFNN